MNPLVRILIGFLILSVGFLIVWKTETVFKWTGTIAFAEAKFGSGQTRLFLKLIGLLIVFVGIFTATGIINSMLASVARLLTPGI